MDCTLTLGDGFCMVCPFPEALLTKLHYWKRTLVVNQRTHKREFKGKDEILYQVESSVAPDGTVVRTCITLPGFAKRCKDFLVSYGCKVTVVDKRTPMPAPDYAKAFDGLREYQYELVYNMLANGGGILSAATGCHAPGTEVLKYDGTLVKVEDVKVGDQLLGPDGKPRNVLDLHHGTDLMYKIIPTKGEPFVVNRGHILTLFRTPKRKVPIHPGDSAAVIDISVASYISTNNFFKHRHKLWRSGAVSFAPNTDAYLPIPPYILGVLLGDGSLTQRVEVSLADRDTELVDAVMAWCTSCGYAVHKIQQRGSSLYSINAGIKGRSGTSVVNAQMRKLGLLPSNAGNKFIPVQYKTASVEDRIEILSGLIDTDGSKTGNEYDIVFKSKQLADDTVFIARSLGLAAYVHECQKTCCNTGVTGTYHRISISGDTSFLHCRVSRKRCKPRAQIKDVRRTGFSIEPVGPGTYFGFEVDGDHRYLMGDFTITHNSGKSHIMKALCNAYPHDALMHRGTPQIVVAVPDKDITRKNYDDFVKLLPDRDVGIIMSGVNKPSDDIQVITLDSLHKLNAEDVGVLIVDEMHTAASDTRSQELLRFTKARAWGVSATPDGRFDGKDVVAEGIFGPVVATFSYQDGVKAGALVPIKVYWIDAPEPHIGLESYLRYNTRDSRYKWAVYNNTHLNRMIGRIYKTFPQDKQVLGMLQFTKHMEQVLRGCAIEGVSPLPLQGHAGTDPAAFKAPAFQYVHAISPKERKELYGVIASGEGKQAISTHIYKQGVNFVQLSAVINLGGGGSEIVAKQVPGRASRKIDGKESAYIIEFRHPWDTQKSKIGRDIMGPVAKDDSARMKIYEELGFEQIIINSEKELPWLHHNNTQTL